MEKQLVQLMNNVKTYCKRVMIMMVTASFACAALITVNGEAAKNVLPFKQVALSECTHENQTYAFGDIQHEDYKTVQNHALIAEAFVAASAIEPDNAEMEEKETTMVAQAHSAVSAAPVYADPSMNGYECIGTFLTTGYCACMSCCGKTNGITASGALAQANHTIAADTRVLPFGTQVVMDGKVYTVEDRGGAIKGNRIDIYFASHQDALIYGKRYVKVYRYVGTSENASTVVVETMSQTPGIETTTEVPEGTDTTTEAAPEITTDNSTSAPTDVTPSTTEVTTEEVTTEVITESTTESAK